MEPKILYLDIETKPATAYVWRMWDENITPDQLIDRGGLLAVGMRWGNERRTRVLTEWEDGLDGMLDATYAAFNEADAIVTYNGDKFDIPKLKGEWIMAGYAPPKPPVSLDLIKPVKKLGLLMNRLAYVGPALLHEGKLKHDGFKLWFDVLEGDEKSRKLMKRYCARDVDLLVDLYSKVKPYMDNHPFLYDGHGHENCGTCGSTHLQRRGTYRTKATIYQRLYCPNCGSWTKGKGKRVP